MIDSSMNGNAMAEADTGLIYLENYRASAWLVDHVDLAFEIADGETFVTARLSLRPNPSTDSAPELRLDGEDLDLISIAINGTPVAGTAYVADRFGLVLSDLPVEPFELETRVRILPEKNTRLEGLYRSSGVWCTQCEAEGFRRITFMLDRPDIMATYRVRIEADREAAPVLLANGNPVSSGALDGGRHYAVWDDPHPKPSYLFALVAGRLDAVHRDLVTASGADVRLGVYVEPGKAERAQYALDALERSMRWDEERFGREYDLSVFNIVAVSDFNLGAMENKGLNIFNDRYVLADPATATDADYANIERIIAHEYFHNWTGNRITCRDWFQLCLKEGLTVYRDQEFTSDARSRPVKRIEDVRTLRAAQFPEDAGPLAHPPRPDRYKEINNFYTATVYEKGAEIVRMLATLLGDDGFAKGMELYFARHDGQAATIEEFLASFADANGINLDTFSDWYRQAGTPQVQIRQKWNEEERSLTLDIEQTTAPTPGQADKKPMVLPVRFGLVGPNGADMDYETVTGATVTHDLMRIDEAKAQVTFSGLASRPVLSAFRNFSAPVNLDSDLTQADRLFLARHDSDPFNRWQALQDVALDLMVRAVRADGAFEDSRSVDALAEALGETIGDDQLDRAFRAQAMGLPAYPAIVQRLKADIDPALIQTTRRTLATTLADLLSEPLREIAARHAVSEPYDPGPEQASRRTLVNQCYAYLGFSSHKSAGALLAERYVGAKNMTDRMASLASLVASGRPEAPDALADFKQRFGGDMLSYDKWLALVASDPGPGCLDMVMKASAEPHVAGLNPNRVRSLVGTFASGNPAQFSRPDGAGFDFVAAFAGTCDSANPQLAARLLTAFRSWRLYEPVRREKAETALRALAAKPGLSPDAGDILERTLAG